MKWTLALLFLALSSPGLAQPATAQKPKLIVAISVDQFSAGLFDQYRSSFRFGLKRLIDQGAVFPNGYQSHAATETCPGHSTLLTGKHPSGTGIVANNWFESDKKVYCVEDWSVKVPGRPEAPRGPRNLKASTLGFWLHEGDPNSRTVAVSGKDRAAITMAGDAPTAVFWWDEERGFNTYVKPGESKADKLAPVAAFNSEIDRAWLKKRPVWIPVQRQCAALNSKHAYGDGYEIEHRVPPALKLDGAKPFREDEAFQVWFHASPMLDKLTLDLATRLLDKYQLGKRGSTDLLAVSLSATDYVGHRYGNQGPEMCDQLAHLDRELGRLFKKLDGLGVPFAIVLTADHGGVDAAERTSDRAEIAKRITLDWTTALNPILRKNPELKLSGDPISKKSDPQSLYFDSKVVSEKLRPAVVAATLTLLRDHQNPNLPWAGDVVDAYSREEATGTSVAPGKPADELTLIERYSESVYPGRSPDIFVALSPNASIGEPKPPTDYIAGHGSPWNYDRRVPIVFWRSGGTHFEQYLPIETVDIVPTLAALAEIETPKVDGVCRDLDPGLKSSCR